MKILRSIADRMLILRNPSKTLYLLNIFANSSVKWTSVARQWDSLLTINNTLNGCE